MGGTNRRFCYARARPASAGGCCGKFSGAGFSLIELLVVVAIIALLLSILLPSLASARRASWLAVSLSNMRQLNTASMTYREDNGQYMPLTLTYQRGISPETSASTRLEGWCTWSFAGKNNDAYWARRSFDVEAADRPLNQYLSGAIFSAPEKPQRLAADDPERNKQMEVMRDPSDKFTYQRGISSFRRTPVSGPVSSYDDVGTSYHFNVKWWDQVQPPNGPPVWTARFDFGTRRLRVSDSFTPSRMVWVHDQYADVVANNQSAEFRLKNGFGDFNKSVMGFMDGHAAYNTVYPGRTPRSYSNDEYTFVYEDLKWIPSRRR